MVQLYNEMALIHNNKKEWYTDAHYNMDEAWKHYSVHKKPAIEGHILHDSIHMKYPSR